MTARDQSDAVALANDGHPWPSRTATAKPLSDTFYRTALGSGSIVPPQGEGAAVRRTNFAIGLCAICFIVAGFLAFVAAAYWWR